jgi:nitrogen regulatory protein P-II 1
MKLVIAVIQPDKLDAVREVLLDKEVTRVTVHRASGFGRAGDSLSVYRGQKLVPPLSEKVRLEIACNDDWVDTICDAIVATARHEQGEQGDGKIFIMPLEECIRIRTGERGGAAI